jgi:hypothetical protein
LKKRCQINENKEKKIGVSEGPHLTIDLGDLLRNLLLAPDDEYLCAGPG